MRLLLTSSGIANTSIHDALLGLVGKPTGRLQSPALDDWLTELSMFPLVAALRLRLLPAAGAVWSRRCLGGVSGG
jgi:hypothetical protein